MILASLLLIFSVLVIECLEPVHSGDCTWAKKVAGGSLPHHYQEKFKQCLFEDLVNRTTKDFKQHDKYVSRKRIPMEVLGEDFNPLRLPPDAEYLRGTGRVTVTIRDAEIRQASPNSAASTASLEGYFHLAWKDTRLAWNKLVYNVDSLRVTSSLARRMWFPLFGMTKESGRVSSQASELITPILHSDGTVVASVFLDWDGKCSLNTRDYPYDTAKCRISMEGKWVNESRAIILKNAVKSIKRSKMFQASYYWSYKSGSIAIRKNGNKQYLDIDVDIDRINRSANIEILTPILIATILAMVAPLFGTFKWQSIIKVIALLFMYLSLSNYLSIDWVVRFATNVPKLLEFHQFSMIVTVVALIISLLLWSISRKSHSAPPPHTLNKLTEKMSSLCLCVGGNEETQEGTEASSDSLWGQALAALNCVLFIIFLIIYIIGIIVYCS